MTDITELAQRMKAAAEKASNGDWIKESGDGWEACCSANDQANGGFIIAHFEGPDAAENREFVQAANPANIRALVEALEKAQQRIGKLEKKLTDHKRMNQEMAKAMLTPNDSDAAGMEIAALRQRIAELESRTVKLPKLKMLEDYLAEVAIEERKQILVGVKLEFHRELAAAGIKVEAE
ncbi:ead/Ea22-like family protein [Klebsiella pneumoniae]|uniref:ead/Ea22-like family protein n=1 Tax=Klebsiella pneumoniae TaxID=573 RepID=UPI002A05BE2D|nr:ead/Ea22-like family protein [Klebsiella pneumoniae]MCX9972858.1 ead/Ea22-like family protein [Klebsiella pneumoniae]